MRKKAIKKIRRMLKVLGAHDSTQYDIIYQQTKDLYQQMRHDAKKKVKL